MTDKSNIKPSTMWSSKPVRMKLFGAWEIDKTPPDCIPRLCSLNINRLTLTLPLRNEVTAVMVAVKMQSSKRILRSSEITIPPHHCATTTATPTASTNAGAAAAAAAGVAVGGANEQQQSLSSTGGVADSSGATAIGTITGSAPPITDIELDLSFTLQYPHFLKRNCNYLQIILQRRKKYKNKAILGFKTIAVGRIDMNEVLQRSTIVEKDVDLVMDESSSSGGGSSKKFDYDDRRRTLGRISICKLSSQPIDSDGAPRRGKVSIDRPDVYSDDDDFSSADDAGSDSETIDEAGGGGRGGSKVAGRKVANTGGSGGGSSTKSSSKSASRKANDPNSSGGGGGGRTSGSAGKRFFGGSSGTGSGDKQFRSNAAAAAVAAGSVGNRNFKQKIINLLKKLRLPESDAYDSEDKLKEVIENELIKEHHHHHHLHHHNFHHHLRHHRDDTIDPPDIDEFFDDEEILDDLDDLSDSEPEFDNVSISSTPKPSLRPFFSSSTLLSTLDKSDEFPSFAHNSARLLKDAESMDNSGAGDADTSDSSQKHVNVDFSAFAADSQQQQQQQHGIGGTSSEGATTSIPSIPASSAQQAAAPQSSSSASLSAKQSKCSSSGKASSRDSRDDVKRVKLFSNASKDKSGSVPEKDSTRNGFAATAGLDRSAASIGFEVSKRPLGTSLSLTSSSTGGGPFKDDVSGIGGVPREAVIEQLNRIFQHNHNHQSDDHHHHHHHHQYQHHHSQSSPGSNGIGGASFASSSISASSSSIAIPDEIVFLNMSECAPHGAALLHAFERTHHIIGTASMADVKFCFTFVCGKIQKFCNSNLRTPPPIKIALIGSDSYVNAFLRLYVECLSAKSPDWQTYLRFYVVPASLLQPGSSSSATAATGGLNVSLSNSSNTTTATTTTSTTASSTSNAANFNFNSTNPTISSSSSSSTAAGSASSPPLSLMLHKYLASIDSTYCSIFFGSSQIVANTAAETANSRFKETSSSLGAPESSSTATATATTSAATAAAADSANHSCSNTFISAASLLFAHELYAKIVSYLKSAQLLLQVPVAEAMVTYRDNTVDDAESNQVFIPFICDAKIGSVDNMYSNHSMEMDDAAGATFSVCSPPCQPIMSPPNSAATDRSGGPLGGGAGASSGGVAGGEKSSITGASSRDNVITGVAASGPGSGRDYQYSSASMSLTPPNSPNISQQQQQQQQQHHFHHHSFGGSAAAAGGGGGGGGRSTEHSPSGSRDNHRPDKEREKETRNKEKQDHRERDKKEEEAAAEALDLQIDYWTQQQAKFNPILDYSTSGATSGASSGGGSSSGGGGGGGGGGSSIGGSGGSGGNCKFTLKNCFRNLQISRLPKAGEPCVQTLTLCYVTKEKKQKIMRLGKKKEKENESKCQTVEGICRLVCSYKNTQSPLKVSIDGVELSGVKFFQLTTQWQTQIKFFPLVIFSLS